MPVRKSAKTEPEILKMPDQKVAVVTGKGAPDKIMPVLLPALYGSVFTLKFDLKKRGLETFKVSGLRARYPDAHLMPQDQWTIIMALPVPDSATSLPQKVAGTEVKLDTWHYGTVAQVLYLGPYDQENATILKLHQFITDNGYEIAGHHEEEYLTRPNVKIPKTIIRYQIRNGNG